MTKPQISIILPTNQRLKFLKRAINSVMSQSYTNWEIVVINNKNCKNTKNYIKSLNSQKIRIFPIINNGILAKSKNLGIKKSRGEWIAFLDDDDTWYPDKLKICLQRAQKEKCDFIHHPLHIDSEKKSFFKKIFFMSDVQIKKPVYFNLIYNGNIIAQSSVFVKKKLLIDVKMLPIKKKKLWLGGLFYLVKVFKKNGKILLS